MIFRRRTKIICTYGPAIASKEKVREMVLAGMNVVRVNFSHGDHAYHKQGMDFVKEVREELQQPVAILLDTKGPEIRTGQEQAAETINLINGKDVVLSLVPVENTDDRIYVDYPYLAQDIEVGTKILIDDGRLCVVVKEKNDTEIKCEVKSGGLIKAKRGINIPNVRINLPFLSAKDKNDLKFGAEQQVDFVACSFTRNSEDIRSVRKELYQHKQFSCDLIAKIENQEGVDNITEICEVSDGIMIARGDLGVELNVEEIPFVQKHLISICRNLGRPVITATQMLESMIENARPTRAEVSDVANAIYDSTSAIMLSGETAGGKYPVECVKLMDSIALQTEKDEFYNKTIVPPNVDTNHEATMAMASAAYTTAYALDAAAIVSLTSSGFSPRLVSRMRPRMNIFAVTPVMRVYYKMALYWGVQPLYLDHGAKDLGGAFKCVMSMIEERGLLKCGDQVIQLGGAPVGVSGSTNVLRISSVGSVATRGRVMTSGEQEGQVHVFKKKSTTPEDRILVMKYLLEEDLSVLTKSKGLILETDKGEEMARIVGETLKIPVISRAEGATSLIHENESVNLDANKGIVFRLSR